MKYFLLLFSIFSFAQESKYAFTKGSDTLNNHYLLKYQNKYGYNHVADDYGGYTFRLSFYGTSITVYKTDTLCFGNIRMGVDELGNTGHTGETFTMTFPIEHEEAKMIFNLIEETSIDTIPTDKAIRDWKFGFDGITYMLQHKRDGMYSVKHYWTPKSQGNLPQAVAIEQFRKKIFEIVNLNRISEIFDRYIPFVHYTNGSGSSVLRVLPYDKYKKWRREQSKNRRKKRTQKRI